MHGGEHLNIIERIKPKPPGDAFLGELQDRLENRIRIFLFDKIKVIQFQSRRCQCRQVALVWASKWAFPARSYGY
jgi:hypothetical protein